MPGAITPPASPGTRAWRWVSVPVVVGALVSLTAGVLARHQPRSTGYFQLFFSDPVHLKAGFATAAAVLACLQLLTAAWIFRKLPWPKPGWVNPAHRWTGRLALAFTLPVAYHCTRSWRRRPTGQVGPDLDRLKPPYDRVRLQVVRGSGTMPSFKGKLTPAEIRDVSAYVATYAGP